MQFGAASVPAPFHTGMQDAYMDCLTLLLEDRMAESALYRAVLRKLYALWPPAYHRYYLRGPDSGEPFLTYREWRAVTDELNETLQLHQIMGQAPDSRVMELRRKLLLAQGEPPAAQEDRSRPEIQARMAGSKPIWRCYTPCSTPGSQAMRSHPICPSTSLPRPLSLSRANSVYLSASGAGWATSAGSFGLCPAHGRACSSCPARRKSVASSPKRPANWIPTGSPSGVQCSGTDIAGWPVMLKSGV